MDRGEPSDEPSDAELVEHARAGDRVAMASLVRRHRPMALAMCTGLLHRPEVAEDAVQEALLAAVLGIGRLRRPDRFGPWLCGIALNIARRWLRADGRAPVALDPDHVAVVDPTPGPERLVVASDTASRVRRAVAALPPGQRDALALYYLAERTGSEVADALAISPAATKTRLHKGRLALRRALDDQREVELVSSTIGMRVAEVRREPATAEPVRRYAIVLESDDGGHRFPIYVGEPEATAVALRLAGIELPRPLTHVLLTNTIAALGGRVTGVRVTRLAEQTFFGEIELEARDGPVSIDARPSDAINVALLAEVPIEVELAVLDEVATSPHARVDDALSEGTGQIAAEVEAAFAEARRRYAEPPPEDSATS